MSQLLSLQNDLSHPGVSRIGLLIISNIIVSVKPQKLYEFVWISEQLLLKTWKKVNPFSNLAFKSTIHPYYSTRICGKKTVLRSMTYMFLDILRGESGHIGWNFIHSEPDVMQRPLLLVVRHVRLVLLGHTHNHVTFCSSAPGNLDVELRVHGGGLWNTRDIRRWENLKFHVSFKTLPAVAVSLEIKTC